MKAYKVGRKVFGEGIEERVEALQSYANYSITVYEQNVARTRKEKDGPYATFDTVEHALQFINEDASWAGDEEILRLWECEIEQSEDEKMWYWTGPMKWSCALYKYPKGTILADSVTLTKNIPLEFANSHGYKLRVKEDADV